MNFETLYGWGKGLPIVDWHNHLDMQMLAEDSPLGSLYEVWVKSDPYKHRAMRICGEPERVITGDAEEGEKWAAWMRTLPKLVGNPLFAWARMELRFLFGAGNFSHAETQRRGDGWWRSVENVSLVGWTPSKMLKRFNVEYLSPCVDGKWIMENGKCRMMGSRHARHDNSAFSIVPSLRMNAGDAVSEETLERFHAAGCRVVDISVDDVSALHSQFSILHSQLAFAAAHGWTMLLHLGALRGTSSRLRAVAGPAGGFAGMRAPVDPTAVAAFLDRLEASENIFSRRAAEPQRRGGSLDEKLCVSVPLREINTSLPRTILLSLNPEAHAQLAVLAGSFVEDGVPGKVQLGPAWWWCDHEEGIRDVLEKNAAYGVLSTFVGMTTDSRSLLSFVRHDYFRRVLCKWVADKVASGAFPDDESLLRPMLENVCYRNAHDMVCGRREHKERKGLAASA